MSPFKNPFSRKPQFPEWFGNLPEMDRMVAENHFKLGSDFTKPFAVDNFLYFDAKAAAEKAAKKLSTKSKGWKTEVTWNEAADKWCMSAQNAAYLLDESGLTAMTTLCDEVAEQFGGDYDGWGAPVNTP